MNSVWRIASRPRVCKGLPSEGGHRLDLGDLLRIKRRLSSSKLDQVSFNSVGENKQGFRRAHVEAALKSRDAGLLRVIVQLPEENSARLIESPGLRSA